ncbi:MAG: dehydrogenase [Nitrospirales bacterium]|nr:MAG: dehydrogenase [Nitrospirales bacterium]
MKTVAAILVETGRPLAIEDLEIPKLAPGQVLVEMAYSGVCHTQLLECNGYRGADPFLPHCLGHEGSGTVLEVGAGVRKVKVGQRVILSWIKGTGADVPGTVYEWNGHKVNAGGVTTFSQYTVVSENRLTILPDTIGLSDGAFLGCAVPTGVGAVLNTATLRPGNSLAVFGVGGVGSFAVAGACLSGAYPIVAIDLRKERLKTAERIGATHCIDATEHNSLEEIHKIFPRGVDVAIECSGQTTVMEMALSAVRSQGGIAVIVGNAKHGRNMKINPKELNSGKQLRGTWGGDSIPDRDFERYARLIASRSLTFDWLQDEPYSLLNVNQAISDLEQGKTLRPLLKMVA